jgi:hypothetical protein
MRGDRFPDSPASTRTPEGKDSSAGSKRKAGPGSTSKKKGKTVARSQVQPGGTGDIKGKGVRRKKTTTGGVVFLKGAERQGLTRPKKTKEDQHEEVRVGRGACNR